MSANQAKKLASSYAKLLKTKGIPFSRVFLYGSYAKGKAKKWSDIDICVVSKKFAGRDWDKYEKMLWKLRRQIDARIEPVGMAPDEFTELSPLAHEIKKTGVRVA